MKCVCLFGSKQKRSRVQRRLKLDRLFHVTQLTRGGGMSKSSESSGARGSGQQLTRQESPMVDEMVIVFQKLSHFFTKENLFFQRLGNNHGALGRRKIERGPLWTCRVHRRHLHRGYPIVLPYPRAILYGLSYSYTSTFLV